MPERVLCLRSSARGFDPLPVRAPLQSVACLPPLTSFSGGAALLVCYWLLLRLLSSMPGGHHDHGGGLEDDQGHHRHRSLAAQITLALFPREQERQDLGSLLRWLFWPLVSAPSLLRSFLPNTLALTRVHAIFGHTPSHLHLPPHTRTYMHIHHTHHVHPPILPLRVSQETIWSPSALDDAVSRLAVIGVALAGVVSGYGAAIMPFDFLEMQVCLMSYGACLVVSCRVMSCHATSRVM